MTESLEGKVAVITGGAKGIGRAIAAAFVHNGASVVIVGRDTIALDTVGNEFGASGACVTGDITSAATALEAVTMAIDRFGSLDILVNNAAVYLDRVPLLDTPDDDIETTWRTNLLAPIIWSRAAWRGWMATHGGVIINVSSNTAFQSTFGGAYVSAKVALNHLTRQLAVELAPNVRVNCIAPGLIRTELSEPMFDGPTPPRLPPAGRHGECDDCAGAALYLASDASAFVTGQVLTVDGGASIYDFERGPRMPRTSIRTGPGIEES